MGIRIIEPAPTTAAPTRGRIRIIEPAKPKRGDRRGPVEEVAGALANFNRGTGVFDELAAGMATAVNTGRDVAAGRFKMGPASPQGLNPMAPIISGLKRNYLANLAAQRQVEDDFAARRPNVAAVARGTGMASTALVPAGSAATAPTRLAGAMRGATVAATQAAAYGLADRGTARERLDAAGRSVLPAMALGGVLGAVATPGPGKIPARPELDALQGRAKVDVPAARQAAGEYRGVGIKPALVDVVDDSGRGLVRATAGRMTPARQAATDFRDARALDLPDRIGGQAKRLISSDPRTPDEIRAALTTQRGAAADQAFGAVRDARLTMDPDTVVALRSPDGRAAIKAAANDAMNSLDPADRALASELNRLADQAIDDPSTPITVGMAQSISKSLLDAADVASRAGRNNSARILSSLGRAIRGNAERAVPKYGDALRGYAADSRMIEAADVGEQFMARNTDEFGAAIGKMDPAEKQVAKAAARRAVERSAGENPGAAPGVARRIATAPEQRARNALLLGQQGADDFQNALRMEEMAVRNANDIAPRTGAQTQLRAQDAERASAAMDIGMKVIKQNWVGLAGDWLKSLGINDRVAQQLTETAIDPAKLDDALLYLEHRYGPQAAQAFQRYRKQAIADATHAGRVAGLAVANTNSPPQNALLSSPQ